jgi:hypothetical protein
MALWVYVRRENEKEKQSTVVAVQSKQGAAVPLCPSVCQCAVSGCSTVFLLQLGGVLPCAVVAAAAPCWASEV